MPIISASNLLVLGAVTLMVTLVVSEIHGHRRRKSGATTTPRDDRYDTFAVDAALDEIADGVPPNEGMKRAWLAMNHPRIAERMGWTRPKS